MPLRVHGRRGQTFCMALAREIVPEFSQWPYIRWMCVVDAATITAKKRYPIGLKASCSELSDTRREPRSSRATGTWTGVRRHPRGLPAAVLQRGRAPSGSFKSGIWTSVHRRVGDGRQGRGRDAYKHGAIDYLLKDRLARLAPVN